ncbi:MAG: transposase [Firmicutes bacterium]|nr:transposase [Bacillota bacterium]
MARKPRIHYEGALYHVIVRGNNREYIFDKDEDKEIYLQTVIRYKEKYNFKLYAYCLMDNHAHFLVEINKTPLSKMMQGIQQVFTMKYNKKYNRTGHVFEQRYKAMLCNKDKYLFNLLRYIHQNPVRAGIEEKLNYKWSSHRNYIEMKETGLVDYKYILSFLSKDANKAIKSYAELMEEEIDIKEIKEQELDKGMKHVREHIHQETKKFEHNYIKRKICDYYEIEPNKLSKKTRKQKIVNARKAFILLLKEHSDISNKTLAQELNLAESTISTIKPEISDRQTWER